MRKNIWHNNNIERLETALTHMQHVEHNESESASCNREDSCSDEEAFDRAKGADGMAYAIKVIESKIKAMKR